MSPRTKSIIGRTAAFLAVLGMCVAGGSLHWSFAAGVAIGEATLLVGSWLGHDLPARDA